MRVKEIAKEVCSFPWQLRWHVVNGTYQDTRSLQKLHDLKPEMTLMAISESNLECLLVLVPIGVVEAKWFVDGGALVHELN